jgi:hypothetical protein
VSACDGADGDGRVCTLAAMGSVGQVLRSDAEAFSVFLYSAVGGRIIARAFRYGHVVMSWL